MVYKGLNKLYYTADHKYYIRAGTTKRIALREELLRLFEAYREVFCFVGGLLVFRKKPEKGLPQNGASFAHFKCTEITDELVDKNVVTGRIRI